MTQSITISYDCPGETDIYPDNSPDEDPDALCDVSLPTHTGRNSGQNI